MIATKYNGDKTEDRSLMEFQHVNVKLLLARDEQLDLAPLIPIFNTWIQNQAPDELLLDIADYRHVPEGPGVVLIGHEGNTSVDNTGGRLGVRYNRKAALDGDNRDRLKQAAVAALTACQRLEAEPQLEGKLRFGGQEVVIFVNDRLLAPNLASTEDILGPEFDAFARKLFAGGEYSMSDATANPRSLFTVSLKATRPFSIADLLLNLNS
jgi:hypothetical protein